MAERAPPRCVDDDPPAHGPRVYQVYPMPAHHAALILWRVTTAGREIGRYDDDETAVREAMREARRMLQAEKGSTAVVSVARLDGSVRTIHMTAFAGGV
jgi:hypothetical protein